MKPLEPGCKAMIIGGRCKENIGKVVTVGQYLGDFFQEIALLRDRDIWEVDKNILFTNGDYQKMCSGKTMQRIDGNDTKTIETKKELEIKV